MDYVEWGRGYLEEAKVLKERIAPLNRELKTADHETAPLLYRRIAILEDMYLECLHTGRYLVERGENG